MKAMLHQADQVLRGTDLSGVRAERPTAALARLTALLVLGGLCYGGVMGSYGGFAGDRAWQVVYSAVKVPLLLLVTFLLSLPSFFVLNTLLGVRSDFGQVLRGLLVSQAGLTLILASLAPYTVLWYVSFDDYREAILFNAAMFAAASFAAQLLLRRAYRPLIARNPVHRWLLRLWLVLYAFVGIQMGWVLRPFIGDPDQEFTWFRKRESNFFGGIVNTLRDLVVPKR